MMMMTTTCSLPLLCLYRNEWKCTILLAIRLSLLRGCIDIGGFVVACFSLLGTFVCSPLYLGRRTLTCILIGCFEWRTPQPPPCARMPL